MKFSTKKAIEELEEKSMTELQIFHSLMNEMQNDNNCLDKTKRRVEEKRKIVYLDDVKEVLGE